MESGWGTSPETPRQPHRDHISRLAGANSLLETGNMRFGCELYLHPIASFPFPGKRGLAFSGRFFRLVDSYSLQHKAGCPAFAMVEGMGTTNRKASSTM